MIPVHVKIFINNLQELLKKWGTCPPPQKNRMWKEFLS